MPTEVCASALHSCCRVCLTQEHIMIYVYDRVEEFDLTLVELLATCGNLKIDSADVFSKLICTDCTEELLLVAKFQEKCRTSEETLAQLAESAAELEKQSNTGDEEVILGGEQTYLEYMQMEEELVDGNEDIKVMRADLHCEVIHPESDSEGHNTEVDAERTYEAIEVEIDEADLTDDHFDEDATGVDDGDPMVEQKDDSVISIFEDPGSQITIIEAPPVMNHSCDFCGAVFMQINNLKRHLLTHQEANQLFECETCTMMFTCPIQYHTHMKSHSTETECPAEKPIQPLPPVKTTKPLDQFTTRKRSARKDHECPHCDRSFHSNSLLATHIRTHTGERPFGCAQCDKSFNTRGALDLHMRRHMGVKPYKCNICHKTFAETSNLRVHSRTHTGERPHQCNRCPRSFSRVFLLQNHQRTHTGERPYTCTVCHKGFSQQGDLAAHRRIHTGERPHTCGLCGKGFIKSSALTEHMRRHAKKSSLKLIAEEEGDGGGGGVEEECDQEEVKVGAMKVEQMFIEYDASMG